MTQIINTANVGSRLIFLNLDPKPEKFIVTPAGSVVVSTGGAAAVTLSGLWTATVNGLIQADGPGNGTIGLSQASSGPFNLTVGSKGTINGSFEAIDVAHGCTILNLGHITAPTGVIVGGVGIGIGVDGHNKIINTGSITASYAIFGTAGASINTIVNSGSMTGQIRLGAGADSFTDFAKVGTHIKSGKVVGIIDLGAGNDHFNGGRHAEIGQDGGGNDIYKFGGGNDIYRAANAAGDGSDRIDGGAGRDTYDANAAGGPLKINLDSVKHNLLPISNTPEGIVAAHTATGAPVAGAFKDTIKGFENAKGGGDSDLIYGSAAANKLEGGEGGDNLLGFGGNDELHGGLDSDGIAGGRGRDLLFGESGGDFFQFFSAKDSGLSAKTRDVIMDWDGDDKIVFYFDGNTKKAGHQGFTFLDSDGAAFTGHPGPSGEGEVRVFHTATQTIVQADVNHDGKADISIAINATTGLSVTDFEFH